MLKLTAYYSNGNEAYHGTLPKIANMIFGQIAIINETKILTGYTLQDLDTGEYIDDVNQYFKNEMPRDKNMIRQGVFQEEVIHQDNNGVYAFTCPGPAGHFYGIRFGQSNGKIFFQNGPVKEVGVNGVTNEALLAILIHRTETLNKLFPCAENEAALEHMQKALQSFNDRTANRMARNVEGKNEL